MIYIFYFDGILHLSVNKPNDNNIIEPIESIKNSYSKLTPNHKIIDLIKDFNKKKIEILIATRRKDKKSINLIYKYLNRDDINLNFIDKDNIIQNSKIDFTNSKYKRVYDCDLNNLKLIKNKVDDIQTFYVDPFNLEITEENKLNNVDTDNNERDATETTKVIDIDKLKKKIDEDINEELDIDDLDDLEDDIFKIKNPIIYNVPSNNQIYLPNQTTVPLQTRYIQPLYSQRIGYDFDGVLHTSVTRPDSTGQIHPLNHLRYSPYQLTPNYIIINKIKNQINQGHIIYIITHRVSQASLDTIIKFLSRNDINLHIRRDRILLVTGNKGIHLNRYNITTFYDDSTNVLNDINRSYPNINLYIVNPYNLSIQQYVNRSVIPLSISTRSKFSNASIILFTGRNADRVLLLRDRNSKKWMLPGGRIESRDINPLAGALREFYEETGFRLPYNHNDTFPSYNYHNHTVIYKIHHLNSFGTFIPNREADAIHYVRFGDIVNGNFERTVGRIKVSNKDSLTAMYRYKFIP